MKARGVTKTRAISRFNLLPGRTRSVCLRVRSPEPGERASLIERTTYLSPGAFVLSPLNATYTLSSGLAIAERMLPRASRVGSLTSQVSRDPQPPAPYRLVEMVESPLILWIDRTPPLERETNRTPTSAGGGAVVRMMELERTKVDDPGPLDRYNCRYVDERTFSANAAQKKPSVPITIDGIPASAVGHESTVKGPGHVMKLPVIDTISTLSEVSPEATYPTRTAPPRWSTSNPR